MYIKNYDGLDLKKDTIETIKKDFLKSSKKLNILETKTFFKDAYYFRTGIVDITNLSIFGSSIYNPMLGLNYVEANMFNTFCENSVFSNTGIDYITFSNLTKEKQTLIISVLKNITLNKSVILNSVVEDINKEGEGIE